MAASPVQAARLRTLVLADTAVATSATLFMFSMWATVARSTTLLALTGFVALVAVAIASSLVPLSAGRMTTAINILCVTNWIVAVVASAVATFAWPLMIAAALLPAMLAGSFVERHDLKIYVIGSLIALVLVTASGVLQDFSGMSAEIPEWLRHVVLLVFAPALGMLMTLVALQHSVRLQATLDHAVRAQEALAEHAEELRRSRARVVAATDRERRRIERDLHDGAQSRLVAINLRLSQARTLIDTDRAAADTAFESVRRELHTAQHELRDLAHGVYPTVLWQHGLVSAIQGAADRSAVPVRVELYDVGRHPSEVEAAIYFCVLEALQNATKHARPTSLWVRLGRDDAAVWFEVEDDGIGFVPQESRGVGLDNLHDRLGAIGGSISLDSRLGLGTVVRGTIALPGGGQTLSG